VSGLGCPPVLSLLNPMLHSIQRSTHGGWLLLFAQLVPPMGEVCNRTISGVARFANPHSLESTLETLSFAPPMPQGRALDSGVQYFTPLSPWKSAYKDIFMVSDPLPLNSLFYPTNWRRHGSSTSKNFAPRSNPHYFSLPFTPHSTHDGWILPVPCSQRHAHGQEILSDAKWSFPSPAVASEQSLRPKLMETVGALNASRASPQHFHEVISSSLSSPERALQDGCVKHPDPTMWDRDIMSRSPSEACSGSIFWPIPDSELRIFGHDLFLFSNFSFSSLKPQTHPDRPPPRVLWHAGACCGWCRAAGERYNVRRDIGECNFTYMEFLRFKYSYRGAMDKTCCDIYRLRDITKADKRRDRRIRSMMRRPFSNKRQTTPYYPNTFEWTAFVATFLMVRLLVLGVAHTIRHPIVTTKYIMGTIIFALRCMSRVSVRVVFSNEFTYHFARHLWLAILIYFSGFAEAVGDTPPTKDWNMLHGMKMWNGLPHHEFRKTWWIHLVAALGGIAHSGNTLRQTAQAQDRGRPGEVVPDGEDAAVTAQHRRDHVLRNLRLYASIMNYIDPNCWIYQTLSRAPFVNEGIAVYNYLFEYGHLEMSQVERQELLREWDEMTMFNAGVFGVFEWLQVVQKKADVLQKGLAQQRKKFLEGFPESFDSVVAGERLHDGDGTIVQPAVFPAFHPNAGNANPNAGRPDLMRMAKMYAPEWDRRVAKGQIKAPGKHHARRADIDEDYTQDCDEDGYDSNLSSVGRALAITKAQVTAAMVCMACGGRGHATTVDGVDCLTKQLGITIPRDELLATQYPGNVTFPKPVRRASGKGRGRGSPRRPLGRGKGKAKAVEDPYYEDAEHEDDGDEEEIEEFGQRIGCLAVPFGKMIVPSINGSGSTATIVESQESWPTQPMQPSDNGAGTSTQHAGPSSESQTYDGPKSQTPEQWEETMLIASMHDTPTDEESDDLYFNQQAATVEDDNGNVSEADSVTSTRTAAWRQTQTNMATFVGFTSSSDEDMPSWGPDQNH